MAASIGGIFSSDNTSNLFGDLPINLEESVADLPTEGGFSIDYSTGVSGKALSSLGKVDEPSMDV